MKIKYLLFFIFTVMSFPLFAQTTVIINGGHFQVTGNVKIILQNTSFDNNGTFSATDGEVQITGNATKANSAISGTQSTTFYNLLINKTTNGVQLDNSVNISNQLTLTNGNIDLQNHPLTIQNTASINGGSASSYIQTTGTGTLTQEVGASNIVFPVGNQSYTPVTVNNSGTTDNFDIRVENAVYQNGTSGNEITTDVVDATWHINEATPGGSNTSLTFQWNASDEMTSFDRNNAFVSDYNSNSWNNFTTQAASGSNPYTLTQTGITDFSPFIIGSNLSVLPVEILYFYGEKENENVRLDWQTATELNNSHFDVEWSKDGISFEKIGKVEGRGTTNEVQFYDFLHLSPILGENYYRLKQVDLDGPEGSGEYTDIIQITFDTEKSITINIYPNPAAHYLKIESDDLIGEMIQVFNVNGQLVKEFQHQSLVTNLSITNLPSGTYFVKMGKQVKNLIIEK